MPKSADPIRGILAGVAGGLVASWVMNEFIAGPGETLTRAIETPAEQRLVAMQSDGEDATMKTADVIAATTTGGQHLTHEQRAHAGPVVHYAFGALMGGIYGALAEYSPIATSGFGTGFGTVLFTGADLLAVPALNLAPSPMHQRATAQVPHFAAHLVYGAATELVRRLTRSIL
jgi:putative membrane protein